MIHEEIEYSTITVQVQIQTKKEDYKKEDNSRRKKIINLKS